MTGQSTSCAVTQVIAGTTCWITVEDDDVDVLVAVCVVVSVSHVDIVAVLVTGRAAFASKVSVHVSVEVGVHVVKDEFRVTVVGVDDCVHVKDEVRVTLDEVVLDAFSGNMKRGRTFVSPGHGLTMLLSG